MSVEIPRRILVGFFEREEARDALALASVFSRNTGASLIIAVALRYDPVPRVPATGYDEAIAFHFDALFETAAETLGTREFERRALLDRSPAHALAVAAETEQADLIVLGSSHRGRFTRAYPGDVPSHVLRSAPCTVAVAPPGYASRPELGIDPIGVGYDGGPESVEALDWAAGMAAETAIGATRSQLRRIIRYESVITSLIGGLLGTILGVILAAIVIESLSEFGLGISLPVVQLAVFMGLAVLVGVLGAVAPARRAAQVDPLEAIRYE